MGSTGQVYIVYGPQEAFAIPGRQRSVKQMTITPRISAVLFLLVMWTNYWAEAAIVKIDIGRISHIERCRSFRDDLAREFQKFEHPEDSVIEDLATLSRQRCDFNKHRKRHSR